MTSPNTGKAVGANHPENDLDRATDADLRDHDDAVAVSDAAAEGTRQSRPADANELRPQGESSQELVSLIFIAIFLGLSGLCAVFFL